MDELAPRWFVVALFVFHLVAALAVLAVWIWRRKPKPEVFTEGTPLKLPRREGPHIRVPYNTEIPSIIELNGEKLLVTSISHDFNPAGCQTYATVKPVTIPPSRYEILMEDE